ncbi:Uncharacterized protein SCF082_LOCUS12114 [Durusdinium trenchii]|uniref:Uncharacterized protein n=1 Tax=Durusdinium trenchii TaxID=1381693 RepID=A0ABP0JI50_9DINO
MAPKKRQRTNNVKQDSFIPRTMDEVTDVQRQLRDWVVKAYELRHGGGEKHPFPLDDGGSFLDICRRCWDDKKELLQASVTLVEKVGLMAPGSTVDDFQKKYCLQERGKKRLNGETLALRLTDDIDISEDADQFGVLKIDDGGMKCLAAALVWVGLAFVFVKEPEAELRKPGVVALTSSLLKLMTFRKQQPINPAHGMIQRIIKQNVDAKKLPISSFEWANILGSLQSANDMQEFGVSDAIAIYNASPEVHAAEHGGSGTLAIDSKKVWGIKHWMEKSSQQAHAVVHKTLLDYPFQYGPYGEAFSLTPQMFLGSQAEETVANPQASLAPLSGEANISIDWALPLDGNSQAWLLSRVHLAFQKATAIVDDIKEKKRYRAKAEDLLQLRDLMAFWSQVRSFLSSRLQDFDEFERKLMTSSVLDGQFSDILEQRPKAFSLSMLPSARDAAAKETRACEEIASVEADGQRLEVRSARWNYFQQALDRDQRQLKLVIEAPAKLDSLRHRREMAWRAEQAKVGEKLVLAYCEKFLKTIQIKKMEHLHEHVHQHREFIASAHGIKPSDIYTITLVDLNVPYSNSKERMDEIMTAVSFINDISPTRTVALAENVFINSAELAVVLQHRLHKASFGGWSAENMHYLSVSWIGKDTFSFGQSRLVREVLNAWMKGTLEVGPSQKFLTTPPPLAQKDIESIPGALAATTSLDAMKWEVLERRGDQWHIKEDESRYWEAQGGEITQSFQALKSQHSQLLGKLSGQQATGESHDGGSAPAEEQSETPSLDKLDSMEALKSQQEVEADVASEIQGVRIILTKSGQIWLVCEKDKHLPKNSQLGGFGTGQYSKISDPGTGPAYTFPLKDRTIVQLDETSLRESCPTNSVLTMSLYKLIVTIEREKSAPDVKLSYMTAVRKTDDTVEAGSDAFELTITQDMRFKCIEDSRASAKTTCKNVFSKCVQACESSTVIGTCFRFRYEKVGMSLKAVKPYVICKSAVQLSGNKPVKVAG